MKAKKQVGGKALNKDGKSKKVSARNTQEQYILDDYRPSITNMNRTKALNDIYSNMQTNPNTGKISGINRANTNTTISKKKGGPTKKMLGGMGGGKPLKANGKSAQRLSKAQNGTGINTTKPNIKIEVPKKRSTQHLFGNDPSDKYGYFAKREFNNDKRNRTKSTVKEKPIVTNQTVTPAKKYGGININPANKGKFTATKKATGKTTEQLTHSKNPITKKRAIFAQNAKKWNKKK